MGEPGNRAPSESSRPPGAAPGHHITGPIYYTHSGLLGKGVAWYYDEDTGQEFRVRGLGPPNAGCYHE